MHLHAYCKDPQRLRDRFIKTLMIMKFTVILLVFCFQAGAATVAQTVSLSETNAPLRKIFREIHRQTGYEFFATSEMLKGSQPVSIHVTNEPLSKVLALCFRTQPLEYTIDEKVIVVRKKAAVHEVYQKPEPLIVTMSVSGTVIDHLGMTVPGVNVIEKGTTNGTTTDNEGRFDIEVQDGNSVLVFSFIGYISQEVAVGSQTQLSITLQPDIKVLSEVVVVGYGSQKRSDITGSVASLPMTRMEGVSNGNLAQAIQGGIAGVNVQTTAAGATPSESIMIRGRNSIKASNAPLVVVDGIAGSLNDVNPGDVLSIEVLKDASAAAIYGSRGSNGVILVTTKSGKSGETKLRYSGFYAVQRFANLPEMMSGEEFYKFKLEREPTSMTPSEQDVYDSGVYADWLDLALRKGMSTNHNLSLSGAFKKTTYYVSGDLLKVRGLAVNDDYSRITTRINVDTQLRNWLTVGTRTQLRYTDASGLAPTWDGSQGIYTYNPLTTAFDAEGKLTVSPWPEYNYYRNPLMGLLADNTDESYQVMSNTYAVVDFPFAKGLQYRVNTGVRFGLSNDATYYGRDTQVGLLVGGDASLNRQVSRNIVVENILNYKRDFDKHGVFLTAVYSFENNRSNSNGIQAQGFANDFLSYYGAEQASLVVPSFSNSETTLLSTMARINYSFDSRYLLTVTGRSDGYSGFGAKTKRGFFPSMALGWNIVNEDFFTWKNIFSELKLRTSIGLNGNQAVAAYETISRLASQDNVAGSTTLPGYVPSKLGTDNLGWESTRTLNVGLDFGILNNRISGDINVFRSNTTDLLLDRTISPVSSFTSITQNIGETENRGLEISLVSTNVSTGDFKWQTSGNIAFIKNRIVSLYGYKDENGKEVDDVANSWFIGHPIRVNYGYEWIGVWQLDEAAEAAAHKTQPGFIKIRDVSGPDGVPDGILSPSYDRIIIGQRDPKITWGMNNSFSYKNLTLSVFFYGMHGMTRENTLQSDDVGRQILSNTIKKNWWTPENPTNEWYMNRLDANVQEGFTAAPYENAGFVRLRDVSLSYDFSRQMLSHLGVGKVQVYVSGRNLHTFTKFGGTDPELSEQRDIPMQKEYTVGINLEF